MTDEQTTAGGDASGTTQVKERARGLKDAAESAVDSMGSKAATRGHEAVEEGKEKARELGQEASRKARSRAEEQKDEVAGGMRSVADVIRRGSADLPEDRRRYGRFMETVADRVEDVSGYLERHDVDDLTRDAKRFARENTAMFLGGAFTLGLAGARFLKSSGSRASASPSSGSPVSRPRSAGPERQLPTESSRSAAESSRAVREPGRGEGGYA